FNRIIMKTIGERIRQAREALGLSGDALAKRVGYKNQSAIGNLENRAGGTGGSRIEIIADALNVTVDWLLRGPDRDSVPFANGYMQTQGADGQTPPSSTAQQSQWRRDFVDPVLSEANMLMRKMSPAGREQAILYLRFMATQHAAQSRSTQGERDSIPHQKTA
ncbi:MAG: helix-turn-helix domain-containing protein, partial [Polaromonas sp.]|nr:helix-turn-helix domain-containing protein [Polaromonas sp.]